MLRWVGLGWYDQVGKGRGGRRGEEGYLSPLLPSMKWPILPYSVLTYWGACRRSTPVKRGIDDRGSRAGRVLYHHSVEPPP